MEHILLASQLMVSVCIGILFVRVFGAARRNRRRQSGQDPWPEQPHWAARFRWLHLFLSPFMGWAQRCARPSDRIRRDLWAIGADHRLNDLEFSRLCWALSMALTSSAGAVFLMLWLARMPAPASVVMAVLVCCVGLPFILPMAKLRDMSSVARRGVAAGFPSFLDVLALTLESGQNFQSAMQLSVQRMPQHGPSASLRRQLQEVLRGIRSGQSRQTALQHLASRVELQEVTQFVASMSTAESQGVSVTALLRRQSEQLRTSRSLAAERHAMKMPVKLLAPLAICIFPCTFLVIAFPIAARLSQSGLF